MTGDVLKLSPVVHFIWSIIIAIPNPYLTTSYPGPDVMPRACKVSPGKAEAGRSQTWGRPGLLTETLTHATTLKCISHFWNLSFNFPNWDSYQDIEGRTWECGCYVQADSRCPLALALVPLLPHTWLLILGSSFSALIIPSVGFRLSFFLEAVHQFSICFMPNDFF